MVAVCPPIDPYRSASNPPFPSGPHELSPPARTALVIEPENVPVSARFSLRLPAALVADEAFDDVGPLLAGAVLLLPPLPPGVVVAVELPPQAAKAAARSKALNPRLTPDRILISAEIWVQPPKPNRWRRTCAAPPSTNGFDPTIPELLDNG
jgi:hypothetical protein